jgi:hypothetical protein
MRDETRAAAKGVGRWRVVPLVLVVAVAAILVVRQLRRGDVSGRDGPAGQGGGASGPVVCLRVDYGDGVQKDFTALPWHEGMTVERAMELATRHARGIAFRTRGSGDMAFLTSIDGLENEGSGEAARNWIYRVNGQEADRSFAACPLNAGDEVLWTFGAYE